MFQISEKRERIFLLFFIFIIIFITLIYRLYQIQIAEGSKLEHLARKEHLTSYTLMGKRGIIFDRNLKKLAVNVDSKSLFAMPYKIDNTNEVAHYLEG